MLKQSWGVDRPGPVPLPMSIGKVIPAIIQGCGRQMLKLRPPRVACLALCMDIKEVWREPASLAIRCLGQSGHVLYP